METKLENIFLPTLFIANMEDFPVLSSNILNINTSDDDPNFYFDFDFDEEMLLAFEDENEENIETPQQGLNDEEVAKFINSNKNINTVKKTKTDLNVWKRWCESISEERAMEEIPPRQLNGILCHFFMKIRKLDGTEFEPSTLTSFQRSFDRHLREVGKPYSILTDTTFSKARETLESKRKQLRLTGKGRRPNKALGLNEDEIEKLWSTKQLGNHCPEALIRTVWLNNTMHFGWRARDEHRKVLLGDLEVRIAEGQEKQEYVIWHTERGSKTRTGGKEASSERYFDPRMYSTGSERCPVKILKSYLSRRPKDMMKADDPFYLTPMKNPHGEQWFKRMPLGVHSLGNFMKSMTKAINLPGKHTNHSARRTMITTLRHENISPLDISQLSGHKNLKSIDSYSEASEEQQKKMSLLIRKKGGGKEVLKPLVPTATTSSGMTASSSTSFSGAVFNNCTIVLGSKSPLPCKRRRYAIESDDDE